MFESLDDVRESLLAARFLREEVLAIPVRPDGAARLRAEFLRENAGARQGAMLAAVAAGEDPGFGRVTEEHLRGWAVHLGQQGFRRSAGTPFQGRAAPPPAAVEDLLAEILETVNSPLARETWPVPFRAFALHFLLRLVQPFEPPAPLNPGGSPRLDPGTVPAEPWPAALAATAEAAILASDGFSAARMLLPEPEVGVDAQGPRPDPEAFARTRLHRLVERIADSAARVRAECGRGVLLGWVEERAARLNARQERLLLYLADVPQGAPPRRIAFQDYVRLHAGRRAPSLRSMQRDWQGLRDGGWLLVGGDGRFSLDPEALAFGRA